MRRIGVIVGKTGYGKSYLVKHSLDRVRRLVIFDTMKEYFLPGAVYLTNVDTFRHVLSESLRYEEKEKRQATFRIILRLDCLEDYEDALAMIYVIGDMLVVIEEISNFSNAYGTTETLETLIRFGRHKGVSILGITQRFADLSILLRNNLDMVVAFQLTMPNDLDYLAAIDYIGQEAYQLPSLPRKECRVWTNTR